MARTCGCRGDRDGTDRYSSGPYFTGWTTPAPPVLAIKDLPFPEDGLLPVRFATSWMLREGWKRHGLLSHWQRPGSASALQLGT